MIKVLFFAQIRELVEEEQILLDGSFENVEAIRAELAQRQGKWDLALEPGKLLVAVNQTIVTLEHPVKAGDEVAFFPPVTGG